MSLSVYPTLPGLTFSVLKTPEFNTEVQAAPNKYEVRVVQRTNPSWSFALVYDFLRDYPAGSLTLVSELRTLMGFFLSMRGQAGSFLLLDPDDSSVGPAIITTPWKAAIYYPVGFSILGPSNHWQQVTVAGLSGSSAPAFSTSGGTVSEGPSSPQLTWQDKGAGYSGGVPNVPLAQLSLVSDGAGNWYSPIQRTLDGNFYEDIVDLNGSIAVYSDGALASAGTGAGQYTLSGPGLALPGSSYMGMYLKWGAGSPPAGPITAQFNFYFRVRFSSDAQDFEKFMGIGSAAAQVLAGQGGGLWTIGGSNAQAGSGTLRLETARPVPL